MCAILVAASFAWTKADPAQTLVATLAFAAAASVTAVSAVYSEFYRKPLNEFYFAVQTGVDLLLVTAIVHITGGWSSQFAALYVLVIASSALMLGRRSGYVVAALSCALYLTDLLVIRGEEPHLVMAVQTALFLTVGIGAEAIAARLRSVGPTGELLAAKLVKVQLEAADILRTIRSGIVTVDSNGRLLYANPAAADLLGINLRSLVGRPVLSTLGQISPEIATLLERSAREGKRTTRAEGTIRKGDDIISIGVTTTTIEHDTNGHGQTATAIFQDISDTKRVQELHVRTERLQAVTALSASLAHEIRNPLASIRSATEQLASRRLQLSDVDDDERTLYNLTVREADRLDRLLSEFLDFARARVTRTSAVDISAVAHAASASVGAHPSRSPDIELVVRCDTPLLVEGDEDLLHRALFNLMLNAVQAIGTTCAGSVTVVATTDISSESAAPGAVSVAPTIRITVTDDGTGVPLEVRESLFDPFVTGRVGGSGLGLSVVHRAVEAHNGAVYVDHLDKGTRFTVLLPAVVSGYEDTDTDVFPDIAMRADSIESRVVNAQVQGASV